ncbi:MAG: uracil-DNA glycosylase [Spirochaetia bacterium]
MMDSVLEKYYHILNELNDHLNGGFSRTYPACDTQKIASLLLKKNCTPTIESPTIIPSPVVQQFDSLEAIAECVTDCRACALCHSRKHTVLGEGIHTPQVMVIGEGPGSEEDRLGRPFVGKSGQYLDKWLESIGLDRQKNIYIANVVKCHPPENRDPLPAEMLACAGYLQEQIRLLQPRVILACGRIAGQFLLQKTSALAALRGKIHTYTGIPLIITYHPAAVLRNPDLRRPVWEDLKILKNLIQEIS